MSNTIANQLQIFHSLASSSEVDVTIRGRSPEADAFLESATGSIKGPYVDGTRTIPAAYSFQRNQVANQLTAKVLEPCFWTSQSPSLCRIQLKTPEQRVELDLGLLRFGVKRSSFFLDGRRWVLRAARIHDQDKVDWQEWRESLMSVICRDPSIDLAWKASRSGVALVAELAGDIREVIEKMALLSRVPGVVAYVLDSSLEGQLIRSVAPNQVLLAKAEGTEFVPPSWAHGCVAARERIARIRLGENFAVVALGGDENVSTLSVAERRIRCEALQRSLAPDFDLAGYIA